MKIIFLFISIFMTLLYAEVDDYIYLNIGFGSTKLNLTSKDQAEFDNHIPIPTVYSNNAIDFGIHTPIGTNTLLGYSLSASSDVLLGTTTLVGFHYVLEGPSMLYFIDEDFEGLFYRVHVGLTHSERSGNSSFYGIKSIDPNSFTIANLPLGGMLGVGYRYGIWYTQLSAHLYTINAESATSLTAVLGLFW